MIEGVTRILRRNGELRLVDANGDRVVCRIKSKKTCRRIYHRVDLDAYERDGTIQPACGFAARGTVTWLPRRQEDLEPLWRGCTFHDCFGEASPKTQSGPGLARLLEEMTAEEFDRLRGQR